MIRKVSVRGRKITITCDQKDYDIFFRIGLQLVVDAHFDGKRKVVVVPYEQWSKNNNGEPRKTVNCSDEFSNWCVERAVNQVLREGIAHYKATADIRKWGVNRLDKKTKREVLTNGIGAGMVSAKATKTNFQQCLDHARGLSKEDFRKLRKEANRLWKGFDVDVLPRGEKPT